VCTGSDFQSSIQEKMKDILELLYLINSSCQGSVVFSTFLQEFWHLCLYM
jgi:hypothetical protein